MSAPYCKAGHDYTKKIDERPRRTRRFFGTRHSPFHPNAIPAAYGALAAGEQGKFWEYVDVVFENQNALTSEDLKKYASAVGLDVVKWESDFAKPEHQATVAADIELAQKSGVQGTPTFFVNGLRLAGLYPEEQFVGLINEQKSLATRLVDAGVPPSDLYRRFVGAQYTEPVQGEEYEEEPQQPLVAMVPVDGSPVKGADDALVTIVEFSDFQCPFCSKANRVLEEYLAANTSDTRLVFKHFPLPFHENADITAAVSIVAHQNGKFWKFHDFAFENQDRLAFKDLITYAKKSGHQQLESKA